MDQDAAKQKSALELDKERRQLLKIKLKQLCDCDEIVSAEAIDAIGNVTQDVRAADDNAPSSDELDEDLKEEYQDLNDILDLPDDTYSLTEIRPELPPCVKYGVRSGLTHLNMTKFSPLSRGHQGGAIAIAAFATTAVYKSRCWNEAVIDQIVDDGDTFYCESYKKINTDDRRMLSILDLKRELFVQNKLNVTVSIEDPAYAGKFRSQDPKELHLVKALDLFFKRHTAGILTSPVLNIAVWKDPKYYNIFDGQARKDNCEPVGEGEDGTSKLFLVKDLIGVIFIILEKSKVKNEPFVLYAITISGVELYSHADDPDEPDVSFGKPQRRPSGYKIQEKFRAVVKGSYHLTHPAIPEILRGRAHLILALAALIYSRLVNANKWTSALIDLIFNQANIYLIDLARVLEKKFDNEFELRVDDLIGDIVLGVYSAKVKVRINVVPGYGQKKGKMGIDGGIREFFQSQQTGILEIKKFFYAIWKEDDTYYFFDPFSCDEEGFRVQYSDIERGAAGSKNSACVTMNSSVNQLVETVLENTGNKDRDPFVIHGLKVLYVKTGITPGGPLDKVIYREKDTSRRPQLPSLPTVATELDEFVDMTPRERPDSEKFVDVGLQYPDLMRNVDQYMIKEDEPMTFVVAPSDGEEPRLEGDEEEDEEEEEEEDETEVAEDNVKEPEGKEEGQEKTDGVIDATTVKQVKGYNVINPHRLVLQGTKNCLEEEYPPRSRGRQGLISALTALAYRRLKNPTLWRNMDVDQILDISNKANEYVIEWNRLGRPAIKEDTKEEVEDEEEEEDEDMEELEEEEEEFRRTFPVASHLDFSMLPVRLKLGDNNVVFKSKMNFMDGDANPLANLAEAFECYFDRYTEVVLENKKLMYGIWRENGKYFLFNPYGSDEEGWRFQGYPASLAVTDNLNELIDLLHGVLEYNDPVFTLHFVGLDSIEADKDIPLDSVNVPEDATVQKFRTKFLPITDDDLQIFEDHEVADESAQEAAIDAPKIEGEDDEEDEEEEEGDEVEEDEETTEQTGIKASAESQEKISTCPLLEIEEQDLPDAPYHLNLLLLTSNVKIQEDDDNNKDQTAHEEVILEKLKYNHPPPYVMPPKRTLCTLLEAKRAKRSIPSLVSRFSIDSRLEVKRKGGFSSLYLSSKSILVMPAAVDYDDKPSKMIKLCSNRYLYSRVLPVCLMPLRAVNDKYIQGEDTETAVVEDSELMCKEKDYDTEDIPEVPVGIRITPDIIPLGPTIKTPAPKQRLVVCVDKKKRKCVLAKRDEEDSVMEKVLCSTEDVLMELLFPNFKVEREKPSRENKGDRQSQKTVAEGNVAEIVSTVRMKDTGEKVHDVPEPVGFQITEEDIGIIQGNMSIQDRTQMEQCHFKSCYFSAMLCILSKIRMDINDFRGTTLDQFVLGGDKIYQRTGKLRYKPQRWFHNVEVLDTIYSVIARQVAYADPENCEADKLVAMMERFFEKNSTGIIVFSNCCFAFWRANDRFYLFDSYACDENGNANEDGYACLIEFCDLSSMISRMKQNAGDTSERPYRIYTLSIAHMEQKNCKKRKRKKIKDCIETVKKEPVSPEQLSDDEKPVVEPEMSLIELSDWVTKERRFDAAHNMTIPSFAPIKNYDASMLDVTVLENEITTPILAPFKKSSGKPQRNLSDRDESKLVRRKVYDRKFIDNTIVASPLDLCVIAWSLIHDPILWSTRTVRGLFEACTDYVFDSILAVEDSTVGEMTDGLLPEFEIANYVFHVVFAPLHHGTLYAIEGWNLAMSLQRLFETSLYSGAIVVCKDNHIGVAKRNGNYFAWWLVRKSKNLRMIISEDVEEFLRIIVKKIDESEEVPFVMRIITISYAQKMDPDCDDTKGLHEYAIPTTSLAEVHKKGTDAYDLEAMFRRTTPDPKPVFVLGTVALRDRDSLKEPRVKRCYFVAILATMVKRDIIQSPIPGMIDKVLEVAEGLYREFSDPKFHTEHTLRNVSLMNRIFDFRDCASHLVTLTTNPRTGRNDFYVQVRKHVKRHFKTSTSGILHFSNCCYGFWYSRKTNSYYYLDPYQCNDKGRKVTRDGEACLCIFATVCQMVKHMCFNQSEDTTGFFIHRLHVNSINVPPSRKFQEDPMWLYLDYHWTFSHAPAIVRSCKMKKNQNDDATEQDGVQQFWNNYAIEVSNLIYSVWGTIGCHDSRFGDRAGKNQVAICVAVLAMQYLSHPSRWGPAILDSAVICGDTYYTESQKSATRRCTKHSNKYNLQSCFRVFPHLWTIDFGHNLCGVLYGARNKMNLATTLKIAFEEAPNILIQCNSVTLAALSAEDGYYVADPCWIGPPLFVKNHGAIYVLRCSNMNSLVYAVTKMFNTNQRLEFRVTPIAFTFEQEDFKSTGEKSRPVKKKILTEPLFSAPAKTDGPDVTLPGALTVPDVDTYLGHRNNLSLGIRKGAELENPKIRYTSVKLENDNRNSMMVSTTWHLNMGQAHPLKRAKPPFDPQAVQHVPKECQQRAVHSFEPCYSRQVSITDLLTTCDDYPKVINFMDDAVPLTTTETDRRICDVSPNIAMTLQCMAPRDFITERNRIDFDKWTTDMAHESYNTYQHRIPTRVEIEDTEIRAEQESRSQALVEDTNAQETDEANEITGDVVDNTEDAEITAEDEPPDTDQ